MRKMLIVYYSQKKKLKTRKITRARYLEWMLQWPL